MVGADNPMTGREHSEATKAKLRDAMTGRTASEETKEKMRQAHQGKKMHSQEFRNQVAERNRARRGVFRHSDETRRKISESNVWRIRSGDFRYLGRARTVKAGRVGFRSMWELRAIEILEQDPMVESFTYERLAIHYLWENRKWWTLPDFQVRLTDGQVKIIEVKPRGVALTKGNREAFKMETVRQYCLTRGWVYEVWDELFLWPESCPRDRWECSLPLTSGCPDSKRS